MPRPGQELSKVPASVERFVKQLVVTHKAVMLYPPASTIPRENAEEAAGLLRLFLREAPEMTLAIAKDGLSFEGIAFFEGQSAYASFAQELYNRGLSEMRFHSGATPEDILHFLGVLKTPPAVLAESGGFENRLWDLGVDAITVRMASTRVVDLDGAENLGDIDDIPGWPPEDARIEEIVAAAYGGRPRDQRLLARVLTDPALVARYVRETFATRGESVDGVLDNMRFHDLVHAAMLQPQDVRGQAMRALAEALGELDPEIKRRFVTERLLPDARTDEGMAAVVRQMDVDEVSTLLVMGLTDDTVSIEALSRAIRNLALISLAERDQVHNAAGAAMRAEGLGEGTIDAVFENVTPSRLTVKERDRRPTEDAPEEAILKLMDLAPATVAERFEDDSDFVALQEESRRGLSDGDVVRALVTITFVDPNSPRFSTVMALVEDTIGMLIERGDFDVAADAAEALAGGIASPEVEQVHKDRMASVLERLAGTSEMREITKALRMYRAGTAEHDACARLLSTLGKAAIGPMLEVLADEPDMAARKALVDLITGVAERHIHELAARIDDPRWYVVRNVVSILGSTKRPEIVQPLGRTLRYNDARVRRETIRALAGVHDRLADEMLIAALDDPDAQNVQLAARYLGVAKIHGAVDALGKVALGEGRGNRDTGPRVEAVEALGKIGSADALPYLESLAGRRAIIGAGRSRELKAAAEQAIAALSRLRAGEPQ